MRQLMLALLVTAVMVPTGRTAPGGKDETQAMPEPAALRAPAWADDIPLTPFDRQPLSLGLDTPPAPSAAPGDAALDDPRPTAGATGPGQTGAPDGAAPRRAGVGPVERQAPITFYSCLGPRGGYCGAMSSGKTVYEGAAACGSAYELGQRVSIAGDPTGRVYVCEDRGWLAPAQLDVFWYREEDGQAWTVMVGRWAEVRREP